ncbi:MAG TPA: recombinase family protein [Xanthobacteraceae bacterium]
MTARILPPRELPYRAALYGRASHDPRRKGRSIRDQFAVGELECDDHNWTIVDYYEDRDRSASRAASKKREDWGRLVGDIKAGHVDIVVYAERSRASRRLDVSLELRELCETLNVLLCYDGRVYNMRVASDRKEFTRDAVQSEEEAEGIIGRNQRTARLNAQRGGAHGIAPFGYVRRYDPEDRHLIGQSPHPEHGPAVVEMFERIASGESVSSVLSILRKYRPKAEPTALRVILGNRSYLGIRMHRGQQMPNCQWGPVTDDPEFPAVFAQVQNILADPSRKSSRDNRVVHLLSGLALCAVCFKASGSVADSVLRALPRNEVFRYRCTDSAGHCLIREDVLDAYVEAAVFKWLQSPAAAAAVRPQLDASRVGSLQGRIASMREQLESARQLAGQLDDQGRPTLTIASLVTTERLIIPQIERDEEELGRLLAPQDALLGDLVGLPLDKVSATWQRLQLTQRRRVIRSVVNIRLHPAGRGVQTVRPGRVALTFRGEPGFIMPMKRGVSAKDSSPGVAP